MKATEAISSLEKAIDAEMDLSDITAKPREMTKEEIVAAAEDAAFESEENQ